jgi:hypothetical protein
VLSFLKPSPRFMHKQLASSESIPRGASKLDPQTTNKRPCEPRETLNLSHGSCHPRATNSYLTGSYSIQPAYPFRSQFKAL